MAEQLKGKTEPRLFPAPLRPLTPETSLGFEVVEFAENILDIKLRPWQKWLYIHALELDPESDNLDFRFRTVIVEVARQNGKCIDVETPILTSVGWKKMGDLEVGDSVYHPQGHPVKVTQAHAVKNGLPCYKVTTVDGKSLVVDSEHLWTVQDKRKKHKVWETLTTQELVNRGLYRSPREFAWRLPYQAAVKTPDTDLPIDPYVLGVWLGDGSKYQAELYFSDKDVGEMCELLDHAGVVVTSVKRDRTVNNVRFSVGSPRKGFHYRARKLGVLRNKHVPEQYLTAGTEQRLALLQGLMDTDGSINRSGQAEFSNTNRQIAESVVYLVRSLGWKTSLRTVSNEKNGEPYVYYRVLFTPRSADGYVPFRLARKRERVDADKRTTETVNHQGVIASIEPVATRPVRCIAVDSEDGLFLAGEDLVPTHNTLTMIILGLWKLYVDGCSEILSAAQDLAVAEKTLKEAFSIACSRDALRQHLPFRMDRGTLTPWMRTANGTNQLQLAHIPEGYPEDALDVNRTPPTWYVVATTRGGGRSYSADLAMLDELREHQTFDSWNGIVPATRERPRNQVWGFSNAGDKKSVVLKKQRTIGMRAIEEGDPEARTALFSWSAPDGCSIFDPEGWAAANPSLGYGSRTERDMLADAQGAVDPDDPEGSVAAFRTEFLCQWVETMEVGKIDPETWQGLADDDSRRAPGADVFVGVDVALEGSSAHICIASAREDGRVHVEEVASRAGFEWVPGWFAQRLGNGWFTGEVGIQVKGSPSASLATLLEETEGITVRPWQGSEMPTSTLGFYRAINSDRLRHRNQPGLNAAAEGVRDKKAGDVWIWGRGESVGNASPFIAANIAWWLMRAPELEPEPVSAYETYPDADEGYDDSDADGGLLIL